MGTSRNAIRGRVDFEVTPEFTSSISANYERVRDGGLASYQVASPALPAAYYPAALDQPRVAAQTFDGLRHRNAFSTTPTQDYPDAQTCLQSKPPYLHKQNPPL